ncbi:hypothetical protein V8C86DRAFT_272064 [Haematococcus lacustris]
MDALLIDPQGICQGIVEVKIGGGSPFNFLHDDLGKLLRLVQLVQGRGANLVGGGTAQFSVGVLPVYLVVRDSNKPLDAQETVAQAERHLLKVNVSMALGSANSWRSGVKLLQVSWGGQPDYGGRDGAKEGGRLLSNPTPAPVMLLSPPCSPGCPRHPLEGLTQHRT